MKKIITGGLAATLFIVTISSCINPAPGPHPSTATLTLTCVSNTCPGLTAATHDTSGLRGGTKYVFSVKTGADIPAGTELQVVVDVMDSTALAH